MTTTASALRVQLFGETTVLISGTTFTAPPGKPATVLAVLALAAGEVVRSSALIDALWGDQPPQSARALVHTHVSALRRALNTGSAPAPLPETVPGGYRLALVPEQVDVLRFLGLAAEDLTEHEISEALQVSAAPILNGCDTEFAESWRLRVSTQRTLLRYQAWMHRVDRGDATAVLPDLRAAVQADPLWEGGVLLLARALNDTGRREQALSTLDRYRRQLSEELGLDPSARVTQVHHQLLTGFDQHSAERPSRPLSTVDPEGPDVSEERDARPRTARTTALGVAALVVAALAAWLAVTARDASPVLPQGSAVLLHDPQSGRLRESVELPLDPDAVEVDNGRLWVSSTADRAAAYLDFDDPQSIRVIGLPQPPTSLASAAGTATVGLGFSGQLVTIANGRASPPWSLPSGNEGRLTLASHEGAVWAATIDGWVFGPDLQVPASPLMRVAGSPLRMAIGKDHAWLLTVDRREMVSVPTAGGAPVSSALRGIPVDVAAAEAGAWAVTTGDDRLWKASPTQGRVIATKPLPGPPAGVAVTPGVVWVAVTKPAMLVGYDPVTLQHLRSVDLPRTPADVAAGDATLVVAVR